MDTVKSEICSEEGNIGTIGFGNRREPAVLLVERLELSTDVDNVRYIVPYRGTTYMRPLRYV